MAKKRRKQPEFKPDAKGTGFLKKLHLTNVQRQRLAKWGSYTLLCLLCLLVQDVVMSRVHIFGASTDLVVCAILLITVIEGSETGSLFVLIASTLYYCSGSAPGAYVIALLCMLGIGTTLFRQVFWHRNFSSIALCAGLALMLYEMCLLLAGVFLGLTRWDRAGVFALTGLLSWVAMLPMYPLVDRIGKIGGTIWKE